MSKNEWKKWVGVAGRLLLGYALIFSQSALAGQYPKAADKANARQQTSAPVQERRAPGGPNEGIKVHGHWTIEVRNPDGTVVTHREFENSLLPLQGALLLALALGRQNTVGGWSLLLTVASNQALAPCTTTAGGTACQIFESGAGVVNGPGNNNIFDNLLVSSGAGGALVLSGTAMAGQTGVIDTVFSRNDVCAPTVSLGACAPAPGTNATTTYGFTEANVNPAVNVSNGQTVAVTVKFTFA